MNLKKYLAIIGAVITIGGVVGTGFYIDDRFAHAKDLDQVKKRLEIKIIQDQIVYLQQRIWDLNDRCKPGAMTYDQKVRLRELSNDKKQLEHQLNVKMRE